MKWSTDITVEKLRQIADDVESGAVSVKSVEYKARTWLVGESNPYGPGREHALYPYPPGCSGARLCAFLGLTEDEYLARFERRNLLAQAWSLPLARRAAALLLSEVRGSDRLVFLGMKVAQAFGYKFESLARHEAVIVPLSGDTLEVTRGFTLVGGASLLASARDRVKILIAPHPSGMNRAWNDPAMPGRLRVALADLEGEATA